MTTHNIEAKETNILVSKNARSLLILILATIVIMLINGILGAFKSGKLYKTYDFVEVNILLEDVDYSLPIFESYTKASREIIKVEKRYVYDEETNENFVITVEMYKGYYTKFFFQSYWFYTDTGLNSLTAMILYITLVNFLIAKRSSENPIFKKLDEEINELVIVTNSVPSTTFEPFMEEWNNQRKIKQHISNIKYKLAVLENKTPYKIKKAFYIRNGNGLIYQIPERTLTKKEQKYLEKREALESFITQEYIENHVLFEKVKNFKTIYASFVTTGKNEIVKSTDEYSSIRSNANKQLEDYLRKALLGFAIAFGTGILLSFVLFRLDDDWLFVVFSVALKMLPLILQAILANSYSNKHITVQMIPIQRYRLNLINMYLSTRHEEVERNELDSN